MANPPFDLKKTASQQGMDFADTFQHREDASYVPDKYNDADSFKYNSSKFGGDDKRLRLYNADAPETSLDEPWAVQRAEKQAQWAGMSGASQATYSGMLAKQFTDSLLQSNSFEVMHSNETDIQGKRTMSMVRFTDGKYKGKYLSEVLVANGWARAYGYSYAADPEMSDTYKSYLNVLEGLARANGDGMFGLSEENLSPEDIAINRKIESDNGTLRTDIALLENEDFNKVIEQFNYAADAYNLGRNKFDSPEEIQKTAYMRFTTDHFLHAAAIRAKAIMGRRPGEVGQNKSALVYQQHNGTPAKLLEGIVMEDEQKWFTSFKDSLANGTLPDISETPINYVQFRKLAEKYGPEFVEADRQTRVELMKEHDAKQLSDKFPNHKIIEAKMSGGDRFVRDWGYMFLDPAGLLMGGGAGKTALTTGIKSGVIGGTFTGTYDTLTQMVDKGYVDPLQAAIATSLGVVIGGALGAGIHKGVSAINKKVAAPGVVGKDIPNKIDTTDPFMVDAWVQNQLTDPSDSVATKTKFYEEQGMPKIIAQAQAVNDELNVAQGNEINRRFSSEVDGHDEFHSQYENRMDFRSIQDQAILLQMNNFKQVGMRRNWVGLPPRMFNQLDMTLKFEHPEVYGKFRLLEAWEYVKLFEYGQHIKAFNSSMQKAFPNKGDRDAVMKAIYSGRVKTYTAMLQQPGAEDALNALSVMQKTLDDIWQGLYQNGAIPKSRYKKNYWPRYIKDYKGYVEAHGGDFAKLQKEMVARMEKHMGRKLNDAELTELYRNHYRDKAYRGSAGFKRKASKKEEEWGVPEHLIEFYEDPMVAFQMYVRDSLQDIAVHKFFGKTKHDKMLKGRNKNLHGRLDLEYEIANLVVKDAKLYNRTTNDQQRLFQYLKLYFVDGAKSPSKALTTSKNLVVMSLLGNLKSASSNFYDIANMMIVSSATDVGLEVFKRAGVNTAKVFGVKMKQSIQDNILNVSETVRKNTDSLSGKAADRVLTHTGFLHSDGFVKSAGGAAVIRKAMRDTSTAAGRTKFREKYSHYPDDFVSTVIDDLNNHTDGDELSLYLKYFYLGELMDAQPISKSSSTPTQLATRDEWIGSHFYLFRSFTLRYYNHVRSRVWHEAKKGNYREALNQAARISVLLTGVSVPLNRIQDWLFGDVDDLFEGIDEADAMDAVLENFGHNKYSSRLYRDYGWAGAAYAWFDFPALSYSTSIAAPVVSAALGKSDSKDIPSDLWKFIRNKFPYVGPTWRKPYETYKKSQKEEVRY